MPNALDNLAANVIGPLMRSIFGDYGCTVTVQRKTGALGTDGHTSYTYADDAAATNINATVMDAETALARRLSGLVEGSTMMLIVPRLAAGPVTFNALDKVRITSGPYNGRTFICDTQGNPGIGAAMFVPLSEPQ